MMEHWKERAIANETITIPGKRNIRPLVFKDKLIGSRPVPADIYNNYPWLTNCKYKVIKEMFVPNGDFVYELGNSKKIPKGTLTLVIEIFNENQPSPE